MKGGRRAEVLCVCDVITLLNTGTFTLQEESSRINFTPFHLLRTYCLSVSSSLVI